ncbi:hypothetical protein BD779DRAFT_1507485 [Infundibulicybe gibba]|nr:hypothetical protein BD779DRAFT_1507485 [Infundibulicybe gibba]
MQEELSDVRTPMQQYAAYPFDSDDTYQQGLASILSGDTFQGDLSQETKDEILRRTRVFYFNRVTGNSITMEDARIHELSLNQPTPTSGPALVPTTPPTGAAESTNTDQSEQRVLTFAELQELIESGKVDQIPNNKIIPEQLHTAPPSESTASTRKKPWESADI